MTVNLELILIIIIIAIITSIISFVIAKKINDAKINTYVLQAKARSNEIDNEAKTILRDAKIKARLDCELAFKFAKKEYDEMFFKLTKKEQELNLHFELEHKKLENEYLILESRLSEINIQKNSLKKQENNYQIKLDNIVKNLENISGLTEDEADKLMIKYAKEKARGDISSMFRKEYKQEQMKMKNKSFEILSQAVNRYAGEFAAERLSDTLYINDDSIKGKIIGKDGRNIKTLEMLMGVDIIIDDSPNNITISSFNLYRRSVAIKTLNLLIEDGRIHPAKIEETYLKVKNEFDIDILQEGEDCIEKLGIKNMNTNLVQQIGRLKYRTSYGQNALLHTLEVANLSGLIAGQLGGNVKLARRAGLMHDIGKALTHEVPGSHVDIGVELCKKFDEPKEIINSIYAHHGYEEAKYIESAAVCAADVLSASRPGARREVLENYINRVEAIEKISMNKTGVISSYAINAGRELRVIVKAELINDDESILLASEIALEIEDNIQYPGEIKVHVIREFRSTSYAR